MKRFAIYLAALCVLPAAVAQDERDNVNTGGLDVEFSSGFDGLVDRTGPVPLSFLFANMSGDVLDAELYIVDPLQNEERKLGDIFLSQEARRRFSAVLDLNDWMECFAELRVDSEVIWRRELPLYGDHNFGQATNYALVLNDSGRALQPPDDLPMQEVPFSGNLYGNSLTPTAGPDGFPVRYFQMKSWQVPEHEGPLLPVRAILVLGQQRDFDLNDGQLKALARWVCQGGHLFVADRASDLRQSVIEASPLPPDPPRNDGPFSGEAMGMGRILTYTGDLWEDNSDLNRTIALAIAQQPPPTQQLLIDSTLPGYSRSGAADWNRLWVIGFGVIYGLLSGLVMLAFARQPRRRVIMYISSVVVLACVAAGLLGASLRMSRGDLRWVSVTQLGAGGAVQTGNVWIQSGGALNTRVAMTGRNIDVQSLGPAQMRYYWNQTPAIVRPFTQQHSLSEDDTSFHLNVPMTPWGQERLQAVSIIPDLKPLKIDVDWTTSGKPGSAWPPHGTVSGRVENPMPTTILNPRLLISIADIVTEEEADAAEQAQNSSPWQQPQVQPNTEFLIMQNLPSIEPKGQTEFRADLQLRIVNDRWMLRESIQHIQLTYPRTDRQNSVRAWLIGSLQESPDLLVDEQQSDFTQLSSSHLILQAVDPEHLPDIDQWLGPLESRR